jgi:hypothetical protein
MNLTKKIARIKKLINRLKDGCDVSTSALSRVLTREQLDMYLEDWKEELSLRKIEKPKQAKDYERRIKKATLYYSKMDRFSLARGKARLATKFANKADSAFERAYEYLIEALNANPDLRLWLDREPDPSKRCPIGIPRIIGSGSFECLDKRKYPYPIRTKKELKLHTLELALLELAADDLELKGGVASEPELFIPFSKPKNNDFSSFKY